MRRSILQDLESQKGITHAMVLTHDIDFFFIQNLVLRALRSAGNPALTIFADAGRAADFFATQGDFTSGLGQRYRVVPVALRSGGRFHPKAILLAGREGATLYVGSGNLTYGGWCDNGEIWARFRTADGDSDSAAISAFRTYLEDLIHMLPLAEALRAEWAGVFDPVNRPWVNALPPPDHLVGRLGEGPSLLTRLLPYFKGERLTVCSPYFDPDGEALLALAAAAGVGSAEVLTQEKTTNLCAAVAAGWPSWVKARPVDFYHASANGASRCARLHAKWFLATTGDQAVAIVGSANCSRAALTTQGLAGNAELVVVTKGHPEFLQLELMAELQIQDRPLKLNDGPLEPDEEGSPALGEPCVLAARFQGGQLRVALASVGGFKAREIEADGVLLQTQTGEADELIAWLDEAPRRIRVQGQRDGMNWVTAEFWVDVEADLGGSAGRRRLMDLVNPKAAGVRWGIELWGALIEAAFQEISTPTRHGGVRPARAEARPEDRVWRPEEVFLSDFSLPGYRQDGPEAQETDLGSATLRLIREWVRGEEGLDRVDPLPDEDPDPEDADPEESGDDDDGNVPPPPPPPLPPRKVLSAEEVAKRQREALHTLNLMLEAIGSADFMRLRSPQDIGRAIILLSLLMRTGLQEGWLFPDTFFSLTQRTWRALFFSGTTQEIRGELAARIAQEEDPQAFQRGLSTPRVAAALAAWGLAAHRHGNGIDLTKFDLSCAVSAAHHPWLWRGAPLDRIASELHELVRQTMRPGEDDDLPKWWIGVQRAGAAMAAFESAMADRSWNELRSQFGPWTCGVGTLLWQRAAGWCVAEKAANASKPKEKVQVKKLQGGEGLTGFQAQFLNPLIVLIRVLGDDLLPEVKQELELLAAKVARAYGGQH